MMKKNIAKTQLGSVMIEALAMLALIALVTPVLYKKSAERATELQDINAAGELRAIIKGVDNYISTNYEAIIGGKTIENTCGGYESMDFSDFKNADDHAGGSISASIEVPLEHFCEYLPYGMLSTGSNGKLTVNKSRLFDNEYTVVFKLNGTSDIVAEENSSKGQKVITAFVVTKPNQELKELRANSIASMIGSNGGVATSETEIEGNMGIWGIRNTEEEFGFKVNKGAVVAASIEGISAQNTQINLDKVLHRIKQNENPALNAMETTLYMGLQGATEDKMNDIVNIGHLIVGAEENGGDDNDKLYIATGNINVANNVRIDDQGNIEANNDITAHNDIIADNDITAHGNLTVDGSATIGTTLTAAAEAFQVDATGGVSALSYKTNDDKVKINIDGKTVFAEPMEVGTGTETCTITGDTVTGCALLVKGDLGVTKDLTIGGALNTKNLHARHSLTVGGDSSANPQALKVEYTDGTSTFDFGKGLVTAESSTALKKFNVNEADNVYLNTKNETNRFAMNNNGISILAGVSGGDVNASIDMSKEGQINAYASNELDLEANDIFLNYINNNRYGFRVYKDNGTNSIQSVAKSFTVYPSTADGSVSSFFEVHDNADGKETLVQGMPMIVRDGTFYLQKDNKKNIVRIGEYEGSNAQIDIFSEGIKMKDNRQTQTDSASENILHINLDVAPADSSNYPIYIRKGSIQLKSYENGLVKASSYENYVQADRFKSNTALPERAFINFNDGDATPANAHYEINPAYTSVMHDIKLTTRGGARLSDILPDFINKGIYVVDNTYPANKSSCVGQDNGSPVQGMKLDSYITQSRSQKQSINSCSSYTDEASAWSGFVPTPTCPPGYVKVITLTPSSFQMAETGNMTSDPRRGINMPGDIEPQYYPYIVGGEITTDINGIPDAQNPLYFQKNTWLKSFASKSFADGSKSCSKLAGEQGADCSGSVTAANFDGWDVGLGFVYPYKLFKQYLDELGTTYKGNLDSSECDTANDGDELNKQCIYWNVFPVHAGTLEGYATVYCYFDRRAHVDPNNSNSAYVFNPALVDTTYDQMENFREVHSKNNSTYTDRLNAPDAENPITTEW